MDRRGFLKLAGAGSVLAMAGLSGCASLGGKGSGTAANVGGSVSYSESCDVLIVGSGIAGLSAAMAPSKAGKSVIVAEKNSLLGGESYESTCLIEVQGTSIQRDAGIEGSADEAWKARKAQLGDMKDFELPNEALLEAICRARSSWVDLAIGEYGVSFMDPADYSDSGISAKLLIPKSGLGGNDDIMMPIRNQISEQGVAFMTDMTFKSLITNEDGAVCGARLYSPKSASFTDIQAKSVILATGGWACSQQMINDNLPDILRTGCYGYLADGQAMQCAMQSGAATIDMEVMPDLIGDIPNVDSWLHFAPAIAVSPNGRRFVREDVKYACANEANAQGLGCWWTIFDNSMSEGPQSNNVATTLQKRSDRYVGPCDTLDELAKAMGMDAGALYETMNEYNSSASTGEDGDFGKKAFLATLKAPYHAIKQYPVRFRTVGGLKVNEDHQVENAKGEPIQNLHACGSCAGILSTGFLDNAASGLLAGQNATR